jgi:cytochrome c-type biogenesis protein CcmH/NrfG
MRIEAQVRKRKQATDHRKAEIKETMITVTIVALVLMAGVSGLALLAFILWQAQQQ